MIMTETCGNFTRHMDAWTKVVKIKNDVIAEYFFLNFNVSNKTRDGRGARFSNAFNSCSFPALVLPLQNASGF